MSRSRNRGRNRNPNGSQARQSGRSQGGQGQRSQAQGSQAQGSQAQGSQGQNGHAQGGQGKRRRRRGGQRRPSIGFWGDVELLPEPTTGLRISEQPDAVVRSLGPPPLPGREQIAGHYFLAIYQRAVMTAGALAASGGLIETDDLQREFEESND